MARWDLLNFIKYDAIEFLSEEPSKYKKAETISGII